MGSEMERNPEVADLILKTVVVKLNALEETDKGLLSNLSVTIFDRLGVILNTVKPRYFENVIKTEPKQEDIDSVLQLVRENGLDVGKEEVVLLAKLRRYIITRLKSDGLSLFLGKVLDIEPEEAIKQGLKVQR